MGGNVVARGKYLSLEEARKKGKIKQFAKEHPSECDATAFEHLTRAMALGRTAKEPGTSDAPASEGSSETRSRRGKSKDA